MPSTNYTLTGVSEARGRMEGGFCRGKWGAYGEMGALSAWSLSCAHGIEASGGGDRQ